MTFGDLMNTIQEALKEYKDSKIENMQITVKSAFENAKLRYVLDYIFVERFGCN